MAINFTDLDTIDEPVLREVQIRPFQWAEVDPDKIVISYDRTSDTLLVNLFGQGQPSVSVPFRRYLYALVEPANETIVGIHIEGFLSQAVIEHPEELVLLAVAELRGITPIEVWEMQRVTVLDGWPRQWWYHSSHPSEISQFKKWVIEFLLETENVSWGMINTDAAG